MARKVNNTNDQPLGLLAQFDDPHALLAAAEKVRDAGYTKTDAYVPFPVHGIDEALGIKATILPWIVLTLGVIGGVGGLAMQYWMNAVDYPYLISGKPLFSLPANIPVTFELIILLSAFGVFLGMLGLNKLPLFSNPLFRIPQFARATDDKFFLGISADDPKYQLTKVRALFDTFGPSEIIEIPADPSPAALPRFVWVTGVCIATLMLVPPVVIWKAQNSTSSQPRIRLVQDMFTQWKNKSQTTSTVFADGRASRPRISGTVARGEMLDSNLLTGIRPLAEAVAQVALIAEEEETEPADANEAEQPAEPMPADPMAGEPAAEEEEPNWLVEVPVKVSKSAMLRGQQQYNVYCAVCHGLAGDGDGMVSRRAVELQQPTWVQPTPIHAEHVVEQPAGKLYNTITHGIRKMKGYGSQISPEDRWAIVMYLRALQKMRSGSLDEVPAEIGNTLKSQAN
ncbi:MAG: quinol:electron acceptor oxidoreductase subunit ActD [Pirellulaceae bacterium]